MTPDLLVIGAGIMGLGVAWRAARRGWRVTVLERGALAREASWAAGGMLAPNAEIEFDELELLALGEASQARWPTFVAELEADAESAVGFDDTGTLLVSVDRDEAEAIRRTYDEQRARGLEVAWLSGDACRAAEPYLSPYVHSGIRCPGDYNVDNRRVLDALICAAKARGVRLREGCEVRGVRSDGARVAGVTLASGERVDAPRVVVAAGAWSRQLEGLAPPPRVRPVKGQMLAVGCTDPRAPDEVLLRHVIRSTEVYLVPKAERIVVGATSEERGFDRAVTAGGVYDLLRRAYDVFPAIYELPLLETWVGFRPGSRDNGPLVGPADLEGLYYATGHYRNGIQQAPLTVEGLCAALFGEPMPDALAPFAPQREAAARIVAAARSATSGVGR